MHITHNAFDDRSYQPPTSRQTDMTGTIDSNLVIYNKLPEVPPIPPDHLIDTTNYVLIFNGRKLWIASRQSI